MPTSALHDLDADVSCALRLRFEAVRACTEQLAAPLTAEDQMIQSMPDTSPTKWHRAHTTWFFAEFALEADGTSGLPWDRPEYRFLYNSYYDAVGARHPRPSRGMVSRPTLAEVSFYRAAVDEAVLGKLADIDSLPVDQARKFLDIVLLGTHHEQQHQELLLMDIKHALSLNPAVAPAYIARETTPAIDSGPMGWKDFDGGLVEIGTSPEVDQFSWDNESSRHEVRLYDFALADRLVTTVEWEAFIDDGGYRRPELWKSDGWYRAQSQQWEAPEYWHRDLDNPESWLHHTLSGVRPLDPFEPVVHVSHYEADAFAAWAGARLPTEFEWEHAASLSGGMKNHELGGTVGQRDANFHPAGAGPVNGELRQMFGDCWEWTSSAYQPYPGFEIPAGAIGEYNGKFMSGQQVLRGGSVLTPPGHTRTTYRNFFHPHTRWHASGVRLAVDDRTSR